MELQGKVALVTGAGSGLGREISLRLAKRGVNLALIDVREEAVHQTAETASAAGAAAGAFLLDVGDETGAKECFTRIEKTFGGLDILVNNAAVDHTVSVEELECERWERIIRTNLSGAFIMAKQAFPILRRRGGGNIVNITSTAAKRAWANAAAYHASKWGLLGLSHALHVEGRPDNIRVTAVISGGMKTPFLLERFSGIDESLLQDPVNVARTVEFVLELPEESVIPEIMVLPLRETSWP